MSITDTLNADRERFKRGEEEMPPHLWIQWKGTDVCCDIHCTCGAHLHFDGDFLYAFKCGECGQVYETGTYVAIHPVDKSEAYSVPELKKEET